MSVIQFVDFQPSALPRSGYSARIGSAQWAEVEDFVRNLHALHQTQRQIRDCLLTEKNLSASSGQLQAQMQKWGLRTYKTGSDNSTAVTLPAALEPASAHSGPAFRFLDEEKSTSSWSNCHNSEALTNRLRIAELLRIGRCLQLAYCLFESVIHHTETNLESRNQLASCQAQRVVAILGCLKSAMNEKQAIWALQRITSSFCEEVVESEASESLFHHCRLVHCCSVLQQRQEFPVSKMESGIMILPDFWKISSGSSPALPQLESTLSPIELIGRDFNELAEIWLLGDTQINNNNIYDKTTFEPHPRDVMELCLDAVLKDPRTCGRIDNALGTKQEVDREHEVFQTIYWRLLEEIQKRRESGFSLAIALSINHALPLSMSSHEVAGVMSSIMTASHSACRSAFQLRMTLSAMGVEDIHDMFLDAMRTTCALPTMEIRQKMSVHTMSAPAEEFLRKELTTCEYDSLHECVLVPVPSNGKDKNGIDQCNDWEAYKDASDSCDLAYQSLPDTQSTDDELSSLPQRQHESTTGECDPIFEDPTLSRTLSVSSGSFRLFASAARRMNGNSVKLNSRMSSVKSTLSNYTRMDVDTDLSNILSQSMTISRNNSMLSRMSSIREHSHLAPSSPTLVETASP